jgi:site-specific DNA recombinase
MNQERELKHLAMYLRISQEKKNENVETLSNHREILTEYCKQNGYTYVEFGEVISGGKTEIEDRVQLQSLLNRIEEFDGILVMELSRISRNGLISQTVKQYCIDYDKPIITPFQMYDLANNENHRLMFDLGSLISSHEHGVIGKRSKMNKVQMAKAGLHVAGGVPFGYKRNSKTKLLEIDEEAAKTIRYIFQLHAKGYGSYKIRDILNEEGYKSATGKLFNLPSVKRIIRNPHYKGYTVFNDRKRIKKQGKVTYEVLDTIVVKDTHPAIIPPHEWDAANKDRDIRAERFRGTREKPVNHSEITMLKDLVFCDCCGWKLSIRKDASENTGYTIKRCDNLQINGEMCPNRGIKISYVEEEVLKELSKYKSKLESYLKLVEKNGSEQVKQEQELKLKHLKKRLKEVSDQEKNLMDLAINGIYSFDEIKDKKQELLNTKRQLELQMESLTEEDDIPNVEEVTEKLNEMIAVIDNLDKLNPEEVNRSLKTFIKKIYYSRVMPDDVVKLSPRNNIRKYYPFEIKIDYYQL